MGAGGAARTLLNIINNLDRSRFSPVLVTLNFNGSYEKDLKPDVHFIKLDTKRLSRSVFSLARIIRSEKIDVVFSTIPRVNTIAIIAKILSFSGAKSVIREADNLGGTTVENIKLLGFGAVYKLSDQIVSLSEGVKQNLVQRYKVKVSNIKVIYNPVDLEAINEKISFGEIHPDLRRLFVSSTKNIVTAGRLVPQKDHKTLLKAFSIVHKQKKSNLLILGEGVLKEELKKEAEELGIKEYVYFIGFQENPYIYFKHSDLFVLTSIHEGFSHVIAEALAARTPVISTNCKSGPEEVLDNGRYGVLCEVGNIEELAVEMLKMLSLPEKNINEMVKLGYKRAQHFDAKFIVNQYEKTFIDVLNK
jgi:glycosyltransferase involved in cell wall biosynthesis